jgi:uncharacterized cupin superfamily protein
MDPDEGVFVSKVTTGDWTDDPEVRGTEMHELGPGDIASFPAGLAMTWYVSTPFKELWFFGDRGEDPVRSPQA